MKRLEPLQSSHSRSLLPDGRLGALFVDRDGVMNRRIENGYVLSWRDFEPLAQFVQAARPFVTSGIPIVVVSNQSCVGRGLIDEQSLRAIFNRMAGYFSGRGTPISAYFCCPHSPFDGCDCRKPKPGLFFAAKTSLGVDLGQSAMIGDQQTDVAAGRAAGVLSLLVDAADRRGYLAAFAQARDFILGVGRPYAAAATA